MLPVFVLSWPEWLCIALVCTQLTILSVTVYLHRAQAHRALTVQPALAHLVRAWLWLSTGMSTLQWVAVHRKHHAHCDTVQDPHSPLHLGLATVLLKGAALYAKEANDPKTIERFGRGAPSDWLEHNLYIRHKNLGPVLLTLGYVALFGWGHGLLLAFVQFAWIPAWAAGVINGLAHAKGYRNFNTADASRNLLPWGLWIGGEELHNNHHAHPTSAKLSFHWWELDIGWGAIQLLQALRLVSVKKATRRMRLQAEPKSCTTALVHKVAEHRLLVSRWYHAAWSKTVSELKASRVLTARQARSLRSMLLQAHPTPAMHRLVGAHAELRLMRSHWAELQRLWLDSRATAEDLCRQLTHWCERAEQSGVQALGEFSLALRRVQT
jgi:stearoyl-CoA desaturase (Delta-9 desaturase)